MLLPAYSLEPHTVVLIFAFMHLWTSSCIPCLCSDIDQPSEVDSDLQSMTSVPSGMVDGDDNGTLATTSSPAETTTTNIFARCPDNVECYKLSVECLNCSLNYVCQYGEQFNVTCRAKEGINCSGEPFEKVFKCRYCYQTERWEHSCIPTASCSVKSAPRQYYQSNCTVDDDIVCLGNRKFPKRLPCNWSSGRRWSTALILSITVGGFGADRFYLGHWREGIGKLFSFGGLGVWTLIDVVLIGTGYLGPADGSLYIF